MPHLLSFTFLLFFLPHLCNSQVQIIGHWWSEDTTDVQYLTTVRGDKLAGRLLKIDSTSLVFLLNTGDTLTYPAQAIKSVEIIPKKRSFKRDVICERLLVAPTGFALEKGENEFRNIMFLYNSYHRGITDRITVGATFFSLFILNAGAIDAKFSFELDEVVHLSAGGIIMGGLTYNFPESSDQETWVKFGAMGGVGAITIGTHERFINLGVSRITLLEKGVYNQDAWLYSLGSSFRFGKNNRLFTEVGKNVLNSREWNVGLGISTLYRENSFDFGLVYLPGQRPRMLPVLAYAKRW